MTSRPGPRASARRAEIPPRPSRTAARALRLALLAPLVVLIGVAAACGSTAPPTGTPAASPSPSSSDDGGPAPRSTPWIGNAVIGIEAIGVADGEIRKGINDFNAGVQGNDPALMLRAAQGLGKVDVLLENVDRIEAYEPMRSFAAQYRDAITDMAAAARALEAALEAGDAPGTTAASRDLIASFTAYAAVQSELAEWVVQVPEQKRILVR